jgi:hypothetical protein
MRTLSFSSASLIVLGTENLHFQVSSYGQRRTTLTKQTHTRPTAATTQQHISRSKQHISPQQQQEKDIRNEKQFTAAAHKKFVQQEEDMSGNNLEQ